MSTTSGFESFNDNRNVQIGNNWMNYALVEIQTHVSRYSPPGWNGPAMNGVVFSGGDLDDLIFAHCPVQHIHMGFQLNSGLRRYGISTISTGITVTFYRFKKQPPVSSQSGIQVFDALNPSTLLFDSNSKYAKAVLTLPGDIDALIQIRGYTLGSGRKYAICMPSMTGQTVEQWFQSGGGAGGGNATYTITMYGPRFVCNETGIQTTGQAQAAQAIIPLPNNPGNNVRVSTRNGTPVLVFDVTGF